MDGKLVSSSPPKEKTTYADLFDELCPQYMAFGMTYNQFWYGDPSIAKTYRKAQIIKEKQVNTHMWLLGAYVYEVICDLAPILNVGAKKNAKPTKWRERPYPLTKEDKEEEERIKLKESDERCKAFFKKFK